MFICNNPKNLFVVEFGIFGRCTPFLLDGESCDIRALKSSFNKHVYLLLCPCGEGLKCVDGGNLLGTCQSSKTEPYPNN